MSRPLGQLSEDHFLRDYWQETALRQPETERCLHLLARTVARRTLLWNILAKRRPPP